MDSFIGSVLRGLSEDLRYFSAIASLADLVTSNPKLGGAPLTLSRNPPEKPSSVQPGPAESGSVVLATENHLREYNDHSLQLIFGDQGFLLQRALAALAAIWDRFLGLMAAALAAPPFNPPSRPRATAAGFLGLACGGSVLGASPMDSRNTRCASCAGSRGRVFERSGIADPQYDREDHRVKSMKIQPDSRFQAQAPAASAGSPLG